MVPCSLESKKCSSRLFGASKMWMTVISRQKTGSQLFGAGKKWNRTIWKLNKLIHTYFEPEKRFKSYVEIEKSGSVLFGDQKM